MLTSAPLRPRPVHCMIASLHRDRRVAEDVCAGRFTHCGITVQLGPEVDWLDTAGLPDDEEWRFDWHKFYFGLDLADAYRVTGDRRFLDAWEGLVRSFAAQVALDTDPIEVTARRIQNWIHAWDVFNRAGGPSDALAEILGASIAAQADHVRTHLAPERNHRTLELYALFLVALALPALDPVGTLRDFALGQLGRNLQEDVLPDGVHRERSTHYHMVALRSFVGAMENAKRFAVPLPPGFEARVERACEFAAHVHRPDGDIPALSDADTASYLDVIALGASLLGRPDLLFMATSGDRGRLPDERLVSFPSGGYHVQRSGWGDEGRAFADERFLVFDCGPLGDGGHGHYDLLSVEVAADGRALLVDPGRFTYEEGVPNLRRWFKSTAAHNTVCVDGLDQTPYRRGKPRGPVAKGRFLGRWSAPGIDSLWGEAISPCFEARHRRRVILVADDYWLIEDRMTGDLPHRYDLRFHLSAEAWGHTEVDGRTVRAPGLALVLIGGGEPRLEAGWVAPTYGCKRRAPVISTVVERQKSVTFLTLVSPQARWVAPELEVLLADGDAMGTTAVEVRGAGASDKAVDLVRWSGAVVSWTRSP